MLSFPILLKKRAYPGIGSVVIYRRLFFSFNETKILARLRKARVSREQSSRTAPASVWELNVECRIMNFEGKAAHSYPHQSHLSEDSDASRFKSFKFANRHLVVVYLMKIRVPETGDS